MKSVTIYDKAGAQLIRVIHRKNGQYELITHISTGDLKVDVRDINNKKIYFGVKKK